MGAGQAMKRIPRIKFPQRHPKPSGSAPGIQALSSTTGANIPFFSGSKASTSLGGKASLQPKRTPVSNDEIEAILVCKISFQGHSYESYLRITIVNCHLCLCLA
ncbi:hypothetical protein CR513_19087, partial [Mucuna pruriens]